eukprot:TRINITY_DN21100_c0_g2_i1.p1 TRINITY_DN21100_c0_g2~~TRINITY_DN21100_c0_g2_i1.p1  ORF type:complete len:795 (+),score=198.67 TRINITY_DN21100_c0_g2_i1:102-2486(+)
MGLHNAGAASAFIFIAGFVGLLFALFLFMQVKKIRLDTFGKGGAGPNGSLNVPLVGHEAKAEAGHGGEDPSQTLVTIYEAIREGADAFLFAEYRICFAFIVIFGLIVFILVSHSSDTFHWGVGALTATSFAVGGTTSILSGFIGMRVAVFANARTTVAACDPANGWTGAFNTAFRAGGVMGFCLCGLALLMCYCLCLLFSLHYDTTDEIKKYDNAVKLFEAMAGYGLGGSSIAMFGRVGGGIYTKAADVGADLAGKVVEDIPEDDPRNPATIADNVGDNVGDVAGMGSDLFGSFAEATCAALIVGSNSIAIVDKGWGALTFPLVISATGIFVCLVTSFVATNIKPVKAEADVENVLKTQIGVSTVLLTAVLYPIIQAFLPSHFVIEQGFVPGSLEPIGIHCNHTKVFFCIAAGLWGGCIIGFITEYFTSHSYEPTREVARSTETGAATNIIYGLALGYKSAIIPVTVLAVDIFVAFKLCGMYGIALAALGMLSNLATCLAIDVYGPVCDNAGGIAEMSGLPAEVRQKTDALDAAGNTTAAVGKGFAIGSAALVSLALFGAFVTRVQTHALNEAKGAKDVPLANGVNILEPIAFASLVMGAMLPYWFTAMTMKSVGTAAMEMVKEVARQFREIPGLLQGTPGHAPPDHAACIKISTDASLREMILPGALVMLSPIIFGILFGVSSVCGLLAGGMVSGVQLAISQSNTGGAWDNAKKYVERGDLVFEGVVQGKGSEAHKAAVVGDTVGDPLKDTSGPALNILMKLMAIISVVFADFFMSIRGGYGAFKITPNMKAE